MAIKTTTISKKKQIQKPSDFLYNSTIINRFIKKLIKNGKKVTIENLFLTSLQKLKTVKIPSIIIIELINYINLPFETLPKRVGRHVYVIPVPVFTRRQVILSISRLVKIVKNRPEKKIDQRLLNELKEIFIFKKSSTLKDVSKFFGLGIENRMFAHFRWR